MQIQKAIEILTLEITVNLDPGAEDFNDAIRLGIEALKNYASMKLMDEIDGSYLLLGETED